MKHKIYIIVIMLLFSINIWGQVPNVYLYQSLSRAYCPVKVGTNILYYDFSNSKLYKTDGYSSPVQIMQFPYNLSNTSDYIDQAYNNNYYFAVVNQSNHTDIWKSDGTTAGTAIISSINSSSTRLVVVGDSLFYLGADSLYKISSNGAKKGVFKPARAIDDFFAFDNYLLYLERNATSSGSDLMAYNIMSNTVSGPIIYSLYLANDRVPSHVIYNDTLYICGEVEDHLFKIAPGTLNLTPIDTANYHVRKILGRLGNKLIIDCSTDGINFELYFFDLTNNSYQLLTDIYPGNTSSNIDDFSITNWNSVIYFAADDGIHGRELWVTDGTSSGTYMIREIVPGTDGIFSIATWSQSKKENGLQFLSGDTLHFNACPIGWNRTSYYIATKNSLDSLVLNTGTLCGDEPAYWAELNGRIFFTDVYDCAGNANIYFFNRNSSPGIQASNIVFSTVTDTSIVVSWSGGNKGKSAVFVKAINSGTAQPVINTSYTANSIYGLGAQIGTRGWYCVYNGSNSNITITGLQPNTTYRVMVCAYTGNPGSEQYNIYPGTNNPLNVTTLDMNYWTQRANFGGVGREGAVGFSIGSLGYLGTGSSSTSCLKDFWEYNPSTDSWTQKANFGGTARAGAVGFSIGSKGYIGTGCSATNTYFKDFWEYNPSANTWVQKTDFGGNMRTSAMGFSIGGKGYIGTGTYSVTYYNDFWEYDPTTDSWTQKANYSGGVRYNAVGFSINDKGYIGTGVGNYDTRYKDFWEYDPSLNSWTQKANFGGTARGSAVGFSIGTKGYIGTGNSILKDFWQYDQLLNTWVQKVDFSGTGRYEAVGFSIGNKGYIGTGSNYLNDFYEYYDPGIITNDIEISDNNDINIFPNPATDCIRLETSLQSIIKIMNLEGQILKNIIATDNSTTIDISGFAKGMYFVRVKTENGIVVKKFIKE